MEPTYAQFDRIIYPYIEQYWPKQYIHKWHKKDHCLEVVLPPSDQIPFYRGKKPHAGGIHRIFFCSATHPDVVRGVPNIAYAWLDEAAMYDELTWKTLETGIGDLLAPVLFTTTPKYEVGTVWFKELCDKAVNQHGRAIYDYFQWNHRMSDEHKMSAMQDDRDYYLEIKAETDIERDPSKAPPVPWYNSYYEINWTSNDNPYLPIEEKFKLQSDSLDDDMWYQQEILGNFVKGGKFIFANMPWAWFDGLDDSLVTENYMDVDPAYRSEHIEDHSQTAINIAGIGPERDIYNYVNMAGYWDTDEQLDHIFDGVVQYNIGKVGIEHVATYDYMERAIMERQLATGITFEVVPIPHENKDKLGRAQAVTPFVKNGIIKFARNKGNRELILQAETFPLGRWTDRVDALAMLFSPKFGVIEGYRKPDKKKPPKYQGEMLMTDEEFNSSFYSEDEHERWSLVS
jgi:predicted phage terminase large subunit-like protein